MLKTDRKANVFIITWLFSSMEDTPFTDYKNIPKTFH